MFVNLGRQIAAFSGLALMPHLAFHFVPRSAPFAKIAADCGMIDGAGLNIGQQVLLAHIRDVAIVAVLREQVIEWLVLCGADFCGNGIVPFLAIGKNWINIKHYAAKFKDAVAYNVTDCEHGFCNVGGDRIFAHALYIARYCRQIKLGLGKAGIMRYWPRSFPAGISDFDIRPRTQGRGEMAEWSKAPHSKCGVPVTVPRVRIPISPPFSIDKYRLNGQG
jgi:hypothetical protein